jgi:NAD(P)-dependent dehydrogenase (short-subunit alcohol dehydrogenase family)
MPHRDTSTVPAYSQMLDLTGRQFVVLGAGQGIGRQVSHALSGGGAAVLCVDRESELAQAVADEVDGSPWAADVTVRADMEALFAQAQSGGPIHGVVDIVGIAEWGGLLELSDTVWDRQFDVCLRHAYYAVQLAGRAMSETGGGVMVFVTSASATHGAPNHGPYGAAKAALISIVQTAAVELGPLGVRVNGVAPGATMTPRLSRLAEPRWTAQREQRSPLRRLNQPSDIAAAVLFLASDLSRNINGQNLMIDGGMSVLDPWETPHESY